MNSFCRVLPFLTYAEAYNDLVKLKVPNNLNLIQKTDTGKTERDLLRTEFS